MNAPILQSRVATLLERRDKIDAEISELLNLLGEHKTTPTGRRSRLVKPECGTESAYQRHRHYGEEIDEECRAAHRLHNRLAYARKTYGEAS